MVPIAERFLARGTCHVLMRQRLQKYFDEAVGQTSGRIRLKLCVPMATKGQNPFGDTMVLPSWHLPQTRAK